MATQLQIMNRVLKRLREDAVTASTDNQYAGLIAEFVLDAVNAVTEVHNWDSNTHEVEFDTVVGQREYTLSKYTSGGGATLLTTARLPTYRSRIAMVHGRPLAYQYDDGNDTTGEQLSLLSWQEVSRQEHIDTAQTNEKPHYFSLQADGTQQLVFKWAYQPLAVRRIKVHMYTEVQDFESDGTTDNDEIYLPKDPVFWHAVSQALNERGEEYGEPTAAAYQRYQESLAAAIHTDIKHGELTNKFDWYRG